MTMNRRPRAFIGSSREAIPYAQAIAAGLEFHVEVNAWFANTFLPNDYTMEALDRELDANDFGIFVFAAEDVAIIRGQTYFVTRDNTLFEMGLFWGRLGRRRVFCIIPNTVPSGGEDQPVSLHLPSDLDGLTLLKYMADHSRGPDSAVTTACGRILAAVASEGVFRQRHELLEEMESVQTRKDSVLQSLLEYLRNVTIPDAGECYAAAAEAVRNSILVPAGFRVTGAAIWTQVDEDYIGQVGGNVGKGRRYHLADNEGKQTEEEQIVVLKIYGTDNWTFFGRKQIAQVYVLCYALGKEHVLSVHFSGNRELTEEQLRFYVEEVNHDLFSTIKELIGGIRDE
ncbi:TIR domain-containing protein [Paenibacillus tengchongensis]|uniref:TIR domain-containing protein n=1 Tax=Paenibacillus tengchongensis TaxID=2608684 RepID=UPI00124E1B4C|nr:TIR domain-containing protein [Paenibacillus tengchongensis]